MTSSPIEAIADLLIDAYDERSTLPPLTETVPGFDVEQGYDVLFAINARRRAQGWRAVGWKIGFTNRSLWPRYGVSQPMWAPIWDRTLHRAPDGSTALDLEPFVQPRIEPEVVFGLAAPVPATHSASDVLARTEWIAPGFEIVQSHFPEWRFAAADCTAAFGLHGALVVGRPLLLTDAERSRLVDALPHAEVTLRRGRPVGGEVVDKGVGSVVLDGPALALAHLARGLDRQGFASLLAGDIVTTGTITDAWPVAAGETWSSDYGDLGIEGLTLTFAGAR